MKVFFLKVKVHGFNKLLISQDVVKYQVRHKDIQYVFIVKKMLLHPEGLAEVLFEVNRVQKCKILTW